MGNTLEWNRLGGEKLGRRRSVQKGSRCSVPATPFPFANVASGEPCLPLGKRNWKSGFWCEVAWFLTLAADWDFLKVPCGLALRDKQNTSVGWLQPAGYWLVTFGLNSFLKVTGIPVPSAVARIRYPLQLPELGTLCSCQNCGLSALFQFRCFPP